MACSEKLREALRQVQKKIEDSCPSEFDDDRERGIVYGLREAEKILKELIQK